MSSLPTLRMTLLGLVLTSWVITLSLAALSHMQVDYYGLVKLLGIPAVSCSVLIAYAAYRGYSRLSAFSETFAGSLGLAVPIILSTYLAMKAGYPLADAKLQSMDEMLFDWATFIRFVEERPLLATVLSLAYQSFMIQILIVPLALSIFGKAERAYRMVIGFGLIGFVSSIIAIWYPALGTYPRYTSNANEFVNINTHFGYFFLQQFNAVRTDPHFIFTPANLAGIITFPSVHAAVAVLCAWGAWGLKWARFPFLTLNVFMAISAVSHGSHYLIDIPAGIAVAVACITLLTLLTRRNPIHAPTFAETSGEEIPSAGGLR